MSISSKLRFEILNRDNFTCSYCGVTADEELLHVDHVIAKSKGGTDEPGNLVTACADCNAGKSAGKIAKHPKRRSRSQDDLVGRYFHLCRSRTKNVQFQGWVRAKVSDGLYEVEFADWFMGLPNERRLVRVEAMTGEAKDSPFGGLDWRFYDTVEEMREWYFANATPEGRSRRRGQ